MSVVVLPGWFGKLPGMGDFAHRRLPERFREVWDGWLQRGMARLRDRHADWTAHYLQAPVWCFALGRGVVGDEAWIGVLMPSVDGVGRYFPFTLAVELDAAGDALSWWERATRVALEGLESDLDGVRFDALLGEVFCSSSFGGEEEGSFVDWPDELGSVWMVDPVSSARVRCAGLPLDASFESLFLKGDE